jgi:hypothetical protein
MPRAIERQQLLREGGNHKASCGEIRGRCNEIIQTTSAKARPQMGGGNEMLQVRDARPSKHGQIGSDKLNAFTIATAKRVLATNHCWRQAQRRQERSGNKSLQGGKHEGAAKNRQQIIARGASAKAQPKEYWQPITKSKSIWPNEKQIIPTWDHIAVYDGNISSFLVPVKITWEQVCSQLQKLCNILPQECSAGANRPTQHERPSGPSSSVHARLHVVLTWVDEQQNDRVHVLISLPSGTHVLKTAEVINTDSGSHLSVKWNWPKILLDPVKMFEHSRFHDTIKSNHPKVIAFVREADKIRAAADK